MDLSELLLKDIFEDKELKSTSSTSETVAVIRIGKNCRKIKHILRDGCNNFINIEEYTESKIEVDG